MGKTSLPHYVETRVEVPDDPLAVSARLVEAGPHGEYVIYENDGRWCYAGGVLADVRLDRDGARLHGLREAELAWSDRPLRQRADVRVSAVVCHERCCVG